MNKKYTEEQKQAVINQFTDGMSVVAIVSNTGIPRSTVYAWIKIYQTKQNTKEVSLKNFRVLEAKVDRRIQIVKFFCFQSLFYTFLIFLSNLNLKIDSLRTRINTEIITKTPLLSKP